MTFRILKTVLPILLAVLLTLSCSDEKGQNSSFFHPDELKIRIAKIEIDSGYFEEYIDILKEEAAESVKLEEGVLCIYPMYQKENPTAIRLLEIYANEEAYQSHLKTPHFLHYKNTTFKMVKSLELIDMEAIDKKVMSEIFTKMKGKVIF